MSSVGTNVKYTVKGDTLTITVNLKAPTTPSGSGKTSVIASSRGNARVEGRDEFFGLNVYRYPEPRE